MADLDLHSDDARAAQVVLEAIQDHPRSLKLVLAALGDAGFEDPQDTFDFLKARIDNDVY